MPASRPPVPAGSSRRVNPYSFLGSMPLAVVLLGATAAASVIGTLLRQGAPAGDYLAAYGPFWHTLFARLSLYHFYSAPWFLALLAFLVSSVGICLARNGPARLRRVWRAPAAPRPRAPAAPTHRWESSPAPRVAAVRVLRCLHEHGYSTRVSPCGLLISAARGGRGRNLGYLLAHAAVLLIVVGALLDGNPLLAAQLWLERTRPETRDLPASQVPAASRLKADNRAFRAQVRIPEGATVDYAFIYRSDGYLVQELPFLLTLDEFRIERYRSGPPKSFASRVTLRDKHGGAVSRHTLAVNRPLHYHGYDLHQSDFADGGSRLRLRLRDLRRDTPGPEWEGVVGDVQRLPPGAGAQALRLDDFRPHNVVTLAEEETGAAPRRADHGPSFSYTLTAPDGTQRQFRNFMRPVLLHGREYLLSGVREFSGEEFRYLHVPLDEQGSAQPFFSLWRRFLDPQALAAAAAAAPVPVRATENPGARLSPAQWERLLVRLAGEFRAGGVAALRARLARTVPEAQRQDELLGIQLKLLRGLLRHLHEQDAPPGAAPPAFYADALAALAGRPAYGTDLFVRLEDFDLRRASGLIISRSPGRPLVYGGFLALIGGVFLLFYGRLRLVRIALRGPVAGPGSGSLVSLAMYGLPPPPADPEALPRALRTALPGTALPPPDNAY